MIKKIAAMIMIILLFSPTEVLGNGGPTIPFLGLTTGNLIPLKEEAVRIESENLTIKVQSDNTDLLKVAVNVIYKLNNISKDKIHVQVAFPQNGEASDWVVLSNDNEITDLEETLIDINSKLIFPEPDQKTWFDPFNGEKYAQKDLFTSDFRFGAKVFSVNLNPGINTLSVRYVGTTGVDKYRNLKPIYRFDYLLSPASFWGDFNDLSISVETPPNYKLYSNIPLKPTNNHLWVGKSAKLPDRNLSLFLSSDKGTWGGKITTRRQALFLLLTFLMFNWLLRRCYTMFKSAILIILNVIESAITVYFIYSLSTCEFIGYPLTLLQYIIEWSIVFWIMFPLIKFLAQGVASEGETQGT